MQRDLDAIEQLLSLPQEQLLAKLGAEVSPPSIRPLPYHDLVEAGRKWVNGRRQSLRNAICGSARIKSLAAVADQKVRRVSLVTAIADLLAASMAGLPIVTITVLLVQEGIESLCDDDWRPPPFSSDASPSHAK